MLCFTTKKQMFLACPSSRILSVNLFRVFFILPTMVIKKNQKHEGAEARKHRETVKSSGGISSFCDRSLGAIRLPPVRRGLSNGVGRVSRDPG